MYNLQCFYNIYHRYRSAAACLKTNQDSRVSLSQVRLQKTDFLYLLYFHIYKYCIFPKVWHFLKVKYMMTDCTLNNL